MYYLIVLLLQGDQRCNETQLFLPIQHITPVGNFMPYPEEAGRGIKYCFHNHMKIQVPFRVESFLSTLSRVKTQAF